MTEAVARPRRALILIENLPFHRDLRVRRQARALLDAGYDVSVVCPGHRRDPVSPGLEAVRVHPYRPFREPTSRLGFLWEYLYALLCTTALTAKAFVVDRFDFIQACNPPDLLFLVAAPYKLAGRPFVFDHHDLSPELFTARYERETGPLLAALRALERATLSMADHVIATNDSVREVALTRGRKDPRRVSVVRNGPELHARHRSQADPDLRHGLSHLCTWLGIMGSVDDGIDLALRAVHHLAHDLGRRDCHFAFVGDGEDRPRLQRLAIELGVSEWTSFPGWLPHERAFSYLATSTLGLAPDPKSPRLDKATSIKVLEYMAFGLPVVAFDVVETRVSAGPAGVYVPENDPRLYAEAINQLLDDEAGRARMGQLGRERIEHTLAWDHQKHKYLYIYDRLTAKVGRGTPASVEGECG